MKRQSQLPTSNCELPMDSRPIGSDLFGRWQLGVGICRRLVTYASFVRFSHSVFALPFALIGALLAVHRGLANTTGPFLRNVLWIVVAMVAARSAAMGFNRLVDAHYDALNPRTAARELPRGIMSRTEATAFVVLSCAAFVVCAWKL